MSEVYNFKGERDYFQLLTLSAQIPGLRELTDAEGYDPENIKVELKMNNFVIPVTTFNAFLDDMVGRNTRQTEQRLGLTEKLGEFERRVEAEVRSRVDRILSRITERALDEEFNPEWFENN